MKQIEVYQNERLVANLPLIGFPWPTLTASVPYVVRRMIISWIEKQDTGRPFVSSFGPWRWNWK